MVIFFLVEITIKGQRKSFQRHIKEKMAMVAMIGLARGKIIARKMYHSLPPSILAASMSESGTDNIYWRARKIPVGVAAGGIMTPHNELSIPRSRSKRKIGIMITWSGIIRVASMV